MAEAGNVDCALLGCAGISEYADVSVSCLELTVAIENTYSTLVLLDVKVRGSGPATEVPFEVILLRISGVIERLIGGE